MTGAPRGAILEPGADGIPMRDGAATARIGVASTNDHLTRSGAPWFFLGDTIWSAFTHVPESEWADYLRHRRRQGFNALNISILPILHDMSDAPDLASPFGGFWDGSPSFGPLDRGYVDRATAMLELATSMGFVPALVVVWCNYAPETWASRRDPRYVMPGGALPDYIASVVAAFDRFDPIYVVSGDGDFAATASTEFYLDADRLLRALVPDAVTTFHTQDTVTVPAAVAETPGAGFYCYQSGHQLHLQHNACDYAEQYLQRAPRRPVINLEPCYEGHRHGFGEGRYDASDVRRASWQSLLAGASAGIGYGAHGVWQWHRRGSVFSHTEFSGVPFDRWDALRFPGAWNLGMARRIIERYGAHALIPRQDLIVGGPSQVRGATTADGTILLVYAPYADEIVVGLSGLPHSAERWDLASGHVADPDLTIRDGRVVIGLPDSTTDSLIALWPAGGSVPEPTEVAR